MRLALLVITLGACDAALGIETLSRGSPAPLTSCEECAATSCAEPRRACTADRSCQALQACLAKCAPNDARCRMDCETASPIAVAAAPFKALDECLRRSCTESCLGVSGLNALFGPECACLAPTCAPETLACIRTGASEQPGACERRLSCIARNGLDPDHVESCLLTNLEVQNDVGALRRCWSTVECPKCPLARGGAFDCVGRYRWEIPLVPTVSLTFNLTTFDSARTPVEGVTVKACNASTCPECASPVASTVSGANGGATLNLPTGLAGFGGCYTLSKPGLVPMIIHVGHPVVRPGKLDMFVIPNETLPALPTLVSTTLDPGAGHIVNLSLDCLSTPATGLRVEVVPRAPATRSGYFINSGIDTTATGTGTLGTALFVNVPPPAVAIESFRGPTLVAKHNAQIAAGTITVMVSMPRTAD